MALDTYAYLIISMGLVTYLPRWLPLFFLSRRQLPEGLIEWLDLIPASILSALILPALITTGEPRHLDLARPELLVSLPTLLIAIATRSLGGTVIAGMLMFWLAGLLW